MLKKITKVAATATLAAAAAAAIATPASAGWSTYSTSNVKIRTGPSQSYPIVNSGYPGDTAYLYYGVCGQTIYGNKYWDYHYNYTIGVWGYSADYYLTGYADVYYTC